MKDIFIDAQIANKFACPPTECYKDLIKWLFIDDKSNPTNNAILMLSDKLLVEYKKGNVGCMKPTSIVAIIDKVTRDGRFTKIATQELKRFVVGLSKKQVKELRSNKEDWLHFPLVFRSIRKLAIVEDDDFKYDLENFPRLSKGVKVYTSPDNCTYK